MQSSDSRRWFLEGLCLIWDYAELQTDFSKNKMVCEVAKRRKFRSNTLKMVFSYPLYTLEPPITFAPDIIIWYDFEATEVTSWTE